MGIEISKLGPDIENLFPTSFYDYFGLTKTLFRMRVVQLYIPGPFCLKIGFGENPNFSLKEPIRRGSMDFGGFSIEIRIFGTANGQRPSETINKVTKSFPEYSRINIESITNVAGDI